MPTYDYNDLATGEKDSARNVERMTKVAKFSYTVLGTEVATETIRLFKGPPNCEITGYSILPATNAATGTVDIGVEDGSADSIADGVSITGTTFASANVANVSASGKDVYATFATLATPDADTVLTIKVSYDYTT